MGINLLGIVYCDGINNNCSKCQEHFSSEIDVYVSNDELFMHALKVPEDWEHEYHPYAHERYLCPQHKITRSNAD